MTTELTKAAQQALKPHQIAQLVNKLRDIAREFHAHDCLRELISREVNSALTQRPAAQEVDEYGSSEIGWAFIVARDLEPQEKRLMSMLDKAFGSRHPAVDDMVHLILTRSARHQPVSMISGDAARQHPEIKPSKALMQSVWRALKLSMSICDAVPTRAHETDGPMRALGLLVNNVDGAHGYAFIRDTLAKVEQFQRGQAQPVCSIDERAAFEMWIKKDCGDLRTFGTGLNTHYCNSAVNNAWIAWQARASLPTQPAAQATPEPCVTRLSAVEAISHAYLNGGPGGLTQANALLRSAATPPQQAAGEPVGNDLDECPHLIWFDDQDMSPIMFAGAGARAAALQKFKAISGAWNAHLFVRVAKNSRDDRYPCATLATHPAPGVPEAWDEGYKQGVEDERTSEANIGVAGFGAKVAPARQNPYRAAQAKGGE